MSRGRQSAVSRQKWIDVNHRREHMLSVGPRHVNSIRQSKQTHNIIAEVVLLREKLGKT